MTFACFSPRPSLAAAAAAASSRPRPRRPLLYKNGGSTNEAHPLGLAVLPAPVGGGVRWPGSFSGVVWSRSWLLKSGRKRSLGIGLLLFKGARDRSIVWTRQGLLWTLIVLVLVVVKCGQSISQTAVLTSLLLFGVSDGVTAPRFPSEMPVLPRDDSPCTLR